MSPAPRKPPARRDPATKAAQHRRAAASEAPAASPPNAPPPPLTPPVPEPSAVAPPVASAAASFAMPAASETMTTAVDYTAPRVNLLDTGLSDYSFWVAHVASLKPGPLPEGTRTGRIWV